MNIQKYRSSSAAMVAVFAAIFAAPMVAQALVTTNITDGWLKQPVATKGVADKSKVIAPKEEPDACEGYRRLQGQTWLPQ